MRKIFILLALLFASPALAANGSAPTLRPADGGLGNATGDASGLTVAPSSGAASSTLAYFAATHALGTSGAALCLLNASCTWSGAQIFGTDWLDAIIANTASISNLSSLSPNGTYGLLGASRTSGYTAAGHMGTIGVGGFAVNDNTTYANTAYAYYGEARRYPGAGTTHVIEANIINEGSTVSLNPYSSLAQTGLTLGHWLSSGRGDVSSSATASAGFGVINNGANFQRGIVIMKDAINGATGSSGVGEAISMAQGHQITWYAPDGNPGAYVWSAVTALGLEGQALVFADTGPQFQNAAGKALFSVGASASAVDGLTLTPAAAGGVPILSATGSDASIALAIRSKGISPIYLQSGSGSTATQVTPVANGVNYLSFVGGATGAAPQLKASGTDANINLNLTPQGTGVAVIGGNGAQFPSFAYASLPATGRAGVAALCTDCLKLGETTGSGTGMLVFDDGHSHWVSTAGTVAAH